MPKHKIVKIHQNKMGGDVVPKRVRALIEDSNLAAKHKLSKYQLKMLEKLRSRK